MAKFCFPLTKENFLTGVGKGPKNKKDLKNFQGNGTRLYVDTSIWTAKNTIKSRNSSYKKILVQSRFDEVYLKTQNLFRTFERYHKNIQCCLISVFLNPTEKTVLPPKKNKTVYTKINNDEKQYLTVLITVNAAVLLAPQFNYKRIESEPFPAMS